MKYGKKLKASEKYRGVLSSVVSSRSRTLIFVVYFDEHEKLEIAVTL